MKYRELFIEKYRPKIISYAGLMVIIIIVNFIFYGDLLRLNSFLDKPVANITIGEAIALIIAVGLIKEKFVKK